MWSHQLVMFSLNLIQAQWRSFRQRQKVAAEPEGADTQQSPLEVQREASIALERQGIHAERVGRGGHDPCGITRRIRDVQLDPKVDCVLSRLSEEIGCIWKDTTRSFAFDPHMLDLHVAARGKSLISSVFGHRPAASGWTGTGTRQKASI